MSRNSRPHVRDFRDNYATCSDFCEVFRSNTTQLYLLAFLLTANQEFQGTLGIPKERQVMSPQGIGITTTYKTRVAT